MVIARVPSDSIDDRSRPLDYQGLQPVALVQECVHVLLHRLAWQLVLLTPLVVLHLVVVDLIYQILQLLQCQTPHLRRPHLSR